MLVTRLIIPISKLLGNYNIYKSNAPFIYIIPISKLLGNYNEYGNSIPISFIIPISKLLGNYNSQQEFKPSMELYQYLNC